MVESRNSSAPHSDGDTPWGPSLKLLTTFAVVLGIGSAILVDVFGSESSEVFLVPLLLYLALIVVAVLGHSATVGMWRGSIAVALAFSIPGTGAWILLGVIEVFRARTRIGTMGAEFYVGSVFMWAILVVVSLVIWALAHTVARGVLREEDR